ncbi:hypothetical protein CspeluHIS016_0604170 [Cutaneotrichosporon spelunceum]|uniref:Uncharacterized protein n=1 Tax=Cutaneotrichosporon spelunceum TaxID=1672016 RepID=A0AAD3TYV1_9TREE|nr:hypothetical protein CspeluHIS016_0604170 [Cutaneotrichosporon spelunceum]
MPHPINLPPSTPPEVSDDDLHRVVKSIMVAEDTILSTDLPDLLGKIQQDRHGPAALNDSQLRQLCEVVHSDAYSTVAMSREEVFQMLKHLRTTPPALADVATTPTANKHLRRTSTRIRSSSDSSSTEEDEQTPSRPSSSTTGKRPIHRQSFPDDSSPYMLPSTITTSPDGALPPRVKTLSDASTKFEQRSRDDPPSSYMPLGRRPLPQNRRSSAQFSASARSDDGHASSSDYTYTYAKTHARSVSSAGGGSPSSMRSPGAASPTSPGLDDYGSDTEEDRWAHVDPSMEATLDKIREADEVQRLKELVSELRNTIKTLKHERDLAQQAHEDMVGEIESRVEIERDGHESRAKDLLARTKARHQKDMEAKEQEITEVNEKLDDLSTKLADWQAALENEKGKSAELRNTVKERDREVANLRKEVELWGEQKQQVEEDLGRQNAHAADLQEQLNATHDLEARLAAEMAKTDWYKSTFSDMEQEIADLRGGHSYSGSGIGSVGPATLTRNGGNQLSAELQTVDPIKTKLVTRVVTITESDGTPVSTYKDASTETDRLDILNDPEFEEEREALRRDGAVLAEASGTQTPVQSTATLEEEALRSPPAYSAAPGPLDAEALIKHMHPQVTKGTVRHNEDLQKAYDLVSKATGKRCHLIEEELEADDIMRDKHKHDRYEAKPSMAGRVFNWASAIGCSIVFLTALAKAVGPALQRHPYDSLAYSGYVSWVEHTAAMAGAGRVPT